MDRATKRVTFKHEDEVDGMPIGPLGVFDEDSPPQPRAFDPNREPEPWVTLADAERVAEQHGVELEEV
jgi:hypothetical protein